MTPAFIQGIAFETLQTVLLVSAPVLVVSLIVGLGVSVLQATTQINEMTLAYIPKIVAIYATLIVFGGFIIDRLVGFTIRFFSDFERFTQ